MRKINKVILHCSSTRINQNFSIKHIERWHTDPKPKGNGWSKVGYHYYIRLNGEIEEGLSIDEKGIHCKGENYDSIGVCLEGGYNPDGSKWSMCLDAQRKSLKKLLMKLGKENPKITLHGHNEFSSKSCPNFKVKDLNFW